MDNKFTVKTTPCNRASAKFVVRQLKDKYKKLAITEANVELLAKMTRNSVATNDIRSFVKNQSDMRRVKGGLNKKLIKN